MGGDLAGPDFKSVTDINPAYGLMARKYFHSNLAFRVNLLHTRLSASDGKDDQLASRGFSTETPLTELSIDFELDILGHNRNKKKGDKLHVSPYLLLGMGIAFTNPKTDYGDIDNGNGNGDLPLDEYLAVSGTRFALPIGAGLRFTVSRKLAFAVEVASRATFSDYLDGVSQSANPDRKDWYGFGSVQAFYRLSAPDRDEDGVADAKDLCPDIAGTKKASGCPDRDDDGIGNKFDICPDIPGIPAFEGCPDSDEDGIKDSEDGCPTMAGPKNTKGCPDTDGDGIADILDDCPELAGPSKNQGCPSDDLDKDGINNNLDDCPDLPGPAANDGCPYPDVDGDGVADLEDKCPDSKGTAENGGCPEIEISKDWQYLLDFASRNVRFAIGSHSLMPSSFGVLDGVARVMKQYPDYRLKIESYTDDLGTTAFNKDLSDRRAQACFQYLLIEGVAAERMKTIGYGEAYPIATNMTEKGRALNRRVEFTLFR